jgi:uridine kinase
VALSARSEVAGRTAVLVLDGIFLLHPRLRESWDFSVLVTAAPEATIPRARARDAVHFGSPDAVEERYRRRYLPAYELYAAEARPEEHASVVVENDDPVHPALRWPSRAP